MKLASIAEREERRRSQRVGQESGKKASKRVLIKDNSHKMP